MIDTQSNVWLLFSAYHTIVAQVAFLNNELPQSVRAGLCDVFGKQFAGWRAIMKDRRARGGGTASFIQSLLMISHKGKKLRGGGGYQQSSLTSEILIIFQKLVVRLPAETII